MMKFIGREKELARLNSFLDEDGFGAAILYGMRRIGKTELIRQVLKGRSDAVYFLARQVSEEENTRDLCTVFNDVCQQPDYYYADFTSILRRIFEISRERKMILVMDEYPFLKDSRKGIEGLDSTLQSLFDLNRQESRLKVILCGSCVHMMEELMEAENPLHGRFDLWLHLKPMDYLESSGFYPEFPAEDKVRLFSVFGGVPYYNSRIDPALSVKENIIRLIASPDAVLASEVRNWTTDEISQINRAFDVFLVMARGVTRFSELNDKSGIRNAATLTRILEKLQDMGMIRRESPINDPHNRKKIRYVLENELTNFYFKYIYSRFSQFEYLEPHAFFSLFIEEDFQKQYVPEKFEKICRQYLIRQNCSGKLPDLFFEIGKYCYDDPVHHKNGELDIVTNDANGYIFYEAKFLNRPVSSAEIQKEMDQVRQTGLNCYRYGFFSGSGFEQEPQENQIFFTLDDLYV